MERCMQGYSIKDIKAGIYNPPVFVRSLIDVLRSVGEAATDPNTTLAKYPGDYEVYYIGKFNYDNGHLEAIEPEFVTSVVSCIQERNREIQALNKRLETPKEENNAASIQ